MARPAKRLRSGLAAGCASFRKAAWPHTRVLLLPGVVLVVSAVLLGELAVVLCLMWTTM